MVMKVLKVKNKKLVKRDFSKRVLRAHFMIKHRIFGDYIPGDVKCMYEHESKNARMYQQDGCDGDADHEVVTVMVAMTPLSCFIMAYLLVFSLAI